MAGWRRQKAAERRTLLTKGRRILLKQGMSKANHTQLILLTGFHDTYRTGIPKQQPTMGSLVEHTPDLLKDILLRF